MADQEQGARHRALTGQWLSVSFDPTLVKLWNTLVCENEKRQFTSAVTSAACIRRRVIVLMRFTKLDYCQYLLSSQINYTITNLADHLKEISYDQINRYLRSEKLTPRLLWENAKPLIKVSQNRYVIFDDTVLDKRYSEDIELARRQ